MPSSMLEYVKTKDASQSVSQKQAQARREGLYMDLHNKDAKANVTEHMQRVTPDLTQEPDEDFGDQTEDIDLVHMIDQMSDQPRVKTTSIWEQAQVVPQSYPTSVVSDDPPQSQHLALTPQNSFETAQKETRPHLTLPQDKYGRDAVYEDFVSHPQDTTGYGNDNAHREIRTTATELDRPLIYDSAVNKPMTSAYEAQNLTEQGPAHVHVSTTNLKQLQNEPFEAQFQTKDNTPLAERLAKVLQAGDQAAQTALVQSLTIDEWQQAGEWFTEQFGETVAAMTRIRRAKRKVTLDHENEIAMRDEVVSQKKMRMQQDLDEMRTKSFAVLARAQRMAG